MKFNKILTTAVICILALSLSSCSSGGLVGVHNPVPNKAQTADSSVASSQGDAVNYESEAKKWLDKESLWLNADRMPENGINGVYSTGYYLFDIDLDKSKELLVQLGGEQSQNCKTLIYKFDDAGDITQLSVESGLSFSVQNLTLWTYRDGTEFYINEATLKNESDVFITSWNRMSFADGTLTQKPAFFQHIVYDKSTGNVDSPRYFDSDGKSALTDEQFIEAYNKYFKDCMQTVIEPLFIQSADWHYYTQNQKLSALTDALKK